MDRSGVVRRTGPHAFKSFQAFPNMDPDDVAVITSRLDDAVGDVEGLHGVAQLI